MLSQRLQPANGLENASSLAVAGRKAYQTALQERLPLATIAEQSGRAPYWFANNLLLVVDTFGTAPGEGEPVLLTHALISNLKLASDMLALIVPGENVAAFTDLCIAPDQFDRYLKWARTVY